MDTIRKFKRDIEKKLRACLDSGDVALANEITANIMVGIAMMIMIAVSVVALVLNEVGVFTADKPVMRGAVVVSLLIQIPIATVNQLKRGNTPWLKNLLMIGIMLQCVAILGALGHNVTLIMAVPVLLSIRYYEPKFTYVISGISAVLYIIAGILNLNFGVLNLNVLRFDKGSVFTVETTLRDAIMNSGIERSAFLKDYLINDILPKYLVYSIVAYFASLIAKRGREMIDIQNDITKKSAHIETEMNLANEIQTSMLPCIFPAFPKHSQIELFAKNTPAKEVGGDFYDYFQLDDEHICLVMADVSGKGIGAALFMMIAKIVIKNHIQSGKTLAEAMSAANTQLCENNEAGLFVTVWAGVYDIPSGTMKYVNAGHNPPLLKQAEGDWRYLKGINGFVLAGMEDTIYSESEITLRAGDEIILYTDGVTEATNVSNEMYGDARLLDFVGRHTDETAREQVDGLFKEVIDFTGKAPQFDDITVLIMKIR